MALQVSKNIQALADAAEEKRRQQEQGFDPSVAGLGLGGGVRGKPELADRHLLHQSFHHLRNK
jgi:hypothetical protein